MKKWMLILVVILFVASGLMTRGCTSGKPAEVSKVAGKTAQLGELKITVNEAYFHEEYSSNLKMNIWEGFIVELTLKNVGKETEYFLFALYSRFYIQDTEGRVYKNLEAYTGWEYRIDYKMPSFGLHDLELEPGETRDLFLKFRDIPKDAKRLKLFCKESAVDGGKRISIPLDVRAEESESVSEPIDFESWAEAAIAWAESNSGSDHWYKLCLRFVANAFMQEGSPPAEIPEGTWTSTWDAVNGDEDFDLVLHDSDNWRNTPRGGLIFFGKTEDNQFGHIGIYLGNGRIIHAHSTVKTNTIAGAEGLPRVGHYIGWAYPPERWRPVSEPPSVPDASNETQDDKIFTKAPKNAKTPGEIVAAFYFLTKEGKYSEAEKLLTPDYLQTYRLDRLELKEHMASVQNIEITDEYILDHSYCSIRVHFIEGGFDGSYTVDEDTLLAIKRGEPVNLGGQGTQHVELLWVGEEHKAGTEAFVYFTVYCTDNAYPNCEIELIKQNGKWKVTPD